MIALKILLIVTAIVWAFLWKLKRREIRDIEFRRLKQQHEAALFLDEMGLFTGPSHSDFTQPETRP